MSMYSVESELKGLSLLLISGTNFQVAKNMIESSGLKINACEHFGESARMV